MSLFDLILIALVLASVVILSFAALCLIRGQRRRGIAVLRGYAVGAVIYFGIVIAVSLLLPPRIASIGEMVCFDDWCITVEGIERSDSHADSTLIATLRFSNRARRATQRERNLVVYLRDGQGVRLDPVAEKSTIPTDVSLAPMESAVATRSFILPRGRKISALAIAHEGGFPIGWFIIGEGPFRTETLVPLDPGKAP